MLLYFILGIIFISICVPLLQSLASIFSAIGQYVVYIFAFKIYKIKKEMNIEEQEEEQANQIGFATSVVGAEIPVEYEEEEQDE